MKISKAFPSKWLKAEDVPTGRKIPLVISHVELEQVGEEQKPVMYFENRTKGMVLNKTEANKISQIYGDDTDLWSGREIFLYSEQKMMQGRVVPGLSVEVSRPVAAATDDDGEPAF